MNYLNNIVRVTEFGTEQFVYKKFTMGLHDMNNTFYGEYPEVCLDNDDYKKENNTIVIVYTGKLGETNGHFMPVFKADVTFPLMVPKQEQQESLRVDGDKHLILKELLEKQNAKDIEKKKIQQNHQPKTGLEADATTANYMFHSRSRLYKKILPLSWKKYQLKEMFRSINQLVQTEYQLKDTFKSTDHLEEHQTKRDSALKCIQKYREEQIKTTTDKLETERLIKRRGRSTIVPAIRKLETKLKEQKKEQACPEKNPYRLIFLLLRI